MTIADDPRRRNTVFPADSAGDYVSQYARALGKALETVDKQAVNAAFDLLEEALFNGRKVLAAGNGGSAAICDHLVCDWMKGTRALEQPVLHVHSLAAHTALGTAVANDHGYDHIFSAQIEMLGEDGDVCVLISSSGNSPNIVRALVAARDRGMKVIGMTGFSGGALHEDADVSIHIACNNYGLVEDCHQAIMHSIAQLLARRQDKRGVM
ncbi:MAG: SIS domain-containing protein [Acidobacteriota bacterium]|nr:SIS domain-containing protein [Acidobacteriota bacterium]